RNAVAASPQFLRVAAARAKIAAGARGDAGRQVAGLTIQPVVAEILWVEPGNLGLGDFGRVRIDGRLAVVDRDLPRRAADRVGAGDRRRAVGAERSYSQTRDQTDDSRNQSVVRETESPGRRHWRSILKFARAAKRPHRSAMRPVSGPD